MKEKIPAETPPVPVVRSLIADHLTVNIINMLTSAPTNPNVRALVLARLKKPIPPEHVTFDAIQQWIETSFDKPARPVEVDVVIPFTVSDRVTGTCRFSANRGGRGRFPISMSRILELAEECDEMESLMDAIYSEMEECEFLTEDVDMEIDYSNIETSRHEVNDNDGNSWDWDRSIVLSKIKEEIRAHSPETLERLNE